VLRESDIIDLWELLIKNVIAIDGEFTPIKQVWDNWLHPDSSVGIDNLQDNLKSTTLARQLTRPDSEWPTKVKPIERLRTNVYSPVQLLFWKAAEHSKDQLEFEYPFCFSAIGNFINLLLYAWDPGERSAEELWSDNERIKVHRRLAQSVFQLREVREEREPLSIEIELPFEDCEKNELPIKKLAQVFGRGIATSRDKHLSDIGNASGSAIRVFENHYNTPMNRLYSLDSVFGHITENRLSLILRRDGHVTIAMSNNPLLEFYDGGWHTVDISSGKAALQSLLEMRFTSGLDSELPLNLINLSYHLATHWHGGLIAVVSDLESVKEHLIEQTQDDPSKKLLIHVHQCMKNFSGLDSFKISDVLRKGEDGEGLGRLLLSCAIQDGAMILNEKGELLSLGRIVKPKAEMLDSGARRHAAKTLGKNGVAIAISHDGAIRLFSDNSERIDAGSEAFLNVEALRIH